MQMREAIGKERKGGFDMLHNLRGMGISGERSPKECKRDIEKEILEARARQTKVQNLMRAILDYTGPNRGIQGPLAEMVGELVFEENSLNNTVDRLIELQEKEKEQ